jgi:hypothetical protein
MANHQPFGRRVYHGQRSYHTTETARAAALPEKVERTETPVEFDSAIQSESPPPALDDELREWKQSRKRFAHFPWRSLSLMASLCFGIASFALPDSVNEFVQWPLYALFGASLCVGLSGRRRGTS